MNSSAHSTASRATASPDWAVVAALALGLAWQASAARAQGQPDTPPQTAEAPAAPSGPNTAAPQTTDVGGVTVNAPRAETPSATRAPPSSWKMPLQRPVLLGHDPATARNP